MIIEGVAVVVIDKAAAREEESEGSGQLKGRAQLQVQSTASLACPRKSQLQARKGSFLVADYYVAPAQ